MPLFILSNWKWLIPTALCAVLGLSLLFTKLELANLKADVAAAAASATAAARTQEAENARLAAAADRSHMEKLDALEKADTAARDLARTRGLYVKARSQCVPGASADPGSSTDGTTQVRLDDETASALIAIARDGDRAAAYAQTCHGWAMKVGKP